MAKTTCTSFQEMVQCQGEAIHDYYLLVHDSFAKMCEAKPATIGTIWVIPAGAIAIVTADLTMIKTEGIRDAEKFFKHQLFLASLNEMVWVKVMEANKNTLHESMRLAVELETINQVRGQLGVKLLLWRKSIPPMTKMRTIFRTMKLPLSMQFIFGMLSCHSKRIFTKSSVPTIMVAITKIQAQLICRYCKKS